MQEKLLFIGVRPGEARRILAESLETDSADLFRPELAEALPELWDDDEVGLIVTKPGFLPQATEQLISPFLSPEYLSARSYLDDPEFPDMIGRSKTVRELCNRILQVAPTDSTVLIEGESGTGKEVVARTIHLKSHRSKKPFIRLNCAALSETLIESELFGHVQGAFTGAARDRKGRFAIAAGGTLLLDEIGSLPLGSQAKLLRVLQEGEFEAVGSSRTSKVDVRIIATDNSDLAKAVDDGSFRKDLYYRLSVFPIVVPPLRERREDVPLLTEHFLRRYAHLNERVRGISPEALDVMIDYDWSGNVRQLENAVQHALIVETTGTIQPSSLPVDITAPTERLEQGSRSLSLRQKVNQYEKQLVQMALADNNGKKKKAAQSLGIDPKNFSYLLHKHGLLNGEKSHRNSDF